jgi:hypothetical protein
MLYRLGTWLAAVAILSTAAIEIRDRSTRPDFGVIDPTYRSGQETAWFVEQANDPDWPATDIVAAVEQMKLQERESQERAVAWFKQD